MTGSVAGVARHSVWPGTRMTPLGGGTLDELDGLDGEGDDDSAWDGEA